MAKISDYLAPNWSKWTANHLYGHQKWSRKQALTPKHLTPAAGGKLPGFLMFVVKTPVLEEQYRFVYFNIKYLILSSLSSFGTLLLPPGFKMVPYFFEEGRGEALR